MKCERCSQSVRKSAIEDHKDYHCVYIECSCGELVSTVIGVGRSPPGLPARDFPRGNPLDSHLRCARINYNAIVVTL